MKKNAFYTVDMELMESSSYLVKRYRRAKEAAEKKKHRSKNSGMEVVWKGHEEKAFQVAAKMCWQSVGCLRRGRRNHTQILISKCK